MSFSFFQVDFIPVNRVLQLHGNTPQRRNYKKVDDKVFCPVKRFYYSTSVCVTCRSNCHLIEKTINGVILYYTLSSIKPYRVLMSTVVVKPCRATEVRRIYFRISIINFFVVVFRSPRLCNIITSSWETIIASDN